MVTMKGGGGGTVGFGIRRIDDCKGYLETKCAIIELSVGVQPICLPHSYGAFLLENQQ